MRRLQILIFGAIFLATALACAGPKERKCSDGKDNDRDGAIDCADSDCANDPACAPPQAEICDNGVDDDGDGDVDCADSDCSSDPGCQPPPPEICDNGVDDDEDGDVDCDDSDCVNDPACSGPPPSSFTDNYMALAFTGTCLDQKGLRGELPDPAVHGPGPYPVLLWTVGTERNYLGPEAMLVISEAAKLGFVAVSVEYPNNWFQDCTFYDDKAGCIYGSSSNSAVSKVCARPDTDCDAGIVTAGFSQGAMMAILAHDYDSRISGVYALGAGNNISGITDLSACIDAANSSLPDDALVLVNGENDGFFGGTTSAVRAQTEAVAGLSCGPTAMACFRPNGSGWYLVDNGEVSDGQADHCYHRANGGCADESVHDVGWRPPSVAQWGLLHNLGWLMAR